MFDNEFASSSAILRGDEFLILQSHGCRALVAGYLFEPKLHENGFLRLMAVAAAFFSVA
jgi:hypothetical protein